MSRKLAREMTMKLIYQMDIQGDFSQEIIDRFIGELPDDEQQNAYIRDVAEKYLEHKAAIDEKIEQYAVEWKLDRMPKVDAAILRLAVAEIFYREDIPESVAINEAVELAKKYSTDHSGSFINGILGSLVKRSDDHETILFRD